MFSKTLKKFWNIETWYSFTDTHAVWTYSLVNLKQFFQGWTKYSWNYCKLQAGQFTHLCLVVFCQSGTGFINLDQTILLHLLQFFLRVLCNLMKLLTFWQVTLKPTKVCELYKISPSLLPFIKPLNFLQVVQKPMQRDSNKTCSIHISNKLLTPIEIRWNMEYELILIKFSSLG